MLADWQASILLLPVAVTPVPGFKGCFKNSWDKGLTRPHEDEIPIMTEVCYIS